MPISVHWPGAGLPQHIQYLSTFSVVDQCGDLQLRCEYHGEIRIANLTPAGIDGLSLRLLLASILKYSAGPWGRPPASNGQWLRTWGLGWDMQYWSRRA